MKFGFIYCLILGAGLALIAVDVSVWVVLPATLVALFLAHTVRLVIEHRRTK